MSSNGSRYQLTERYICAKLLSRGLLDFENRSKASMMTVVVKAGSQHVTMSRRHKYHP